ncbi:hypothetical protein ASPZODRAFT_66362 [Penicilliopsis zonata CBS 506.65]|uniref:Serine/threonine-protein kinase MEC1 n=1 Tax=Penicilliopsis zonata CBS 506.65 TaxID=1073090 RepID=A0A1L9SGS9_9EURO|nr:hypothetical protein ASPZODRAFT_66362 [Penicilliopsis zonata CBS 506.65]OJJ46333.1 hypothetical protein ASPZODRAFT_66362 [Penicilliopsis zonata CBS 506.65]
MASNGVSRSQDAGLELSRKGTEPASSLLAAQLAPRLSSQRELARPLDRETFSQLRQELLGDRYSQLYLDDSVTDINKLICIVLKAGLEPTCREDGYCDETLKGQVFDCLDIIHAAVEKAPQCVYNISDPEVLGKPVLAPLFTWLVVRLVHLSSIWGCEDISEKATKIISTIAFFQKNPRSWPSCNSILSFLRSFIMDILLSLETSSAWSLQNPAISNLSIPAQEGNLLLDLQRLKIPRGVIGDKMSMGNFPRLLGSILWLLGSMIFNSEPESLLKNPFSDACQKNSWMLNAYQRLWKLILEWLQTTGPSTFDIQAKAAIRFLAFFRQNCGPEMSDSELALQCGGLIRLWLRSLADLCALRTLGQMPMLQSELAQHMDYICENMLRLPLPVQYIQGTILQPLQRLKTETANFQPFVSSLQIAVEHLESAIQADHGSDQEMRALYRSKRTSLRSLLNTERVGSAGETAGSESQARKRRCLPKPHLGPGNPKIQLLLQQVLDSTNAEFKTIFSESLENLSEELSVSFGELSEENKFEVLRSLGQVPCALSQTLLSVPFIKFSEKEVFMCEICDSEKSENKQEAHEQNSSFGELLKIVEDIIPKLSRSPKLRIATMSALRRLLTHDPNPNEAHLASSVFGEFCLHSLRSSIRELRIVTGFCIIAFVGKSIDREVRRSNFVVALEWLKNLSERNETSLQETCILTLCLLAKFSDEEELNIILLRLLEFLGHPNPYICAITHTELSKLAQCLSVTPAGLFRPFWRTLSITVVKHLQSRPVMAEQLCDLLGMKVEDFLRLTEVHVLPYLVLSRKRDIISKLGASYTNAKTPFDLCSEQNNLASILAFLLIQPSTNPEAMTMTLLTEIDAAFRGRSLAELVRIEPILISCDLLKGLGDAGGDKGERFYQALRLLADLVPRKSTHGNKDSKKSNLLGQFIEEHVLGIITQFANAINDFQIRQPLLEKKRNIIAIGEMIKVAKGHVSSALPQICACLRSALGIQELSDYAFKTWGILIHSLQDEELEPLIDQTLTIVIRYWECFSTPTRTYAHELLGYILENHGELVKDIFNTMPSLASIPALDKFEVRLRQLKGSMDVRSQFLAFIRRCQNENFTVVEQALTELVPYILEHEEFLHDSVLSEQPDPVVAQLTRALLDCCVKYNTTSDVITLLSARCLGLIGCLDPNRVDTVREKKDILVLSNFERIEETVEFVLFFLQHVLVEAFLSASDTRAQGFLAYAMQNLLKACNLNTTVSSRSRDISTNEKYRRWLELPESVRNTLMPFLTSKYTVTIGAVHSSCSYPLFTTNLTHSEWLRTFVQDLLQKGSGDNAQLIFSVCSRIVKAQDISIASFLLPFAVLNSTVGGSEEEKKHIHKELLTVLSHPLPEENNYEREMIILCSDSIFEVLDYMSRWLQGKKKQLSSLSSHTTQSNRSHRETRTEFLIDTHSCQIKAVESFLTSIPPEVISRRAVECKSFSRALFHWEQYIRQCKHRPDIQSNSNLEPLYQRLQDIYSQIDEPDGIEGISNHLQGLDIEQQVLEHRKAGRWATAQSWYELQLEREPQNHDAQYDLLTCLNESGQHDAILTHFEVLKESNPSIAKFLSFVIEACWFTGKWDKLGEYLRLYSTQNPGDFGIGVGAALDCLRNGNKTAFRDKINSLRYNVAKSLTVNSVVSLQSCHDYVLKLHTLSEMESIADAGHDGHPSHRDVTRTLDRRLDVLGGYLSDKQYLLGLRRATMELSNNFAGSDIAAAWLTSARLSRKGNFTGQAYQSMLHAARLKDSSATIEHARLLWKDGHHRKAIRILEGAIAANEFSSPAPSDVNEEPAASTTSNRMQHQNLLAARAHLLLAKWTDKAGQTQSDVIVQRYREAINLHLSRWEKAHYYLGKHYNKILDSEKVKPLGKEAQIYLSGEASKLVIYNYLRSLAHGNKYVFQSFPKVLTLWLEHASVVAQPFDPKRGDNEEFQRHSINQRKKSLDEMHSQLKKYLNRMPAALLFTILPQVVARICHPNPTVYELLTKIVVKAVNAFPQQGLWAVLAVVKSSSKERASRGMQCLRKITEAKKKLKSESLADVQTMVNQGQRFSEELLKLCVARVEGKVSKVHLARNLGFNHKVVPCRLVVPFQSMLTPILPANHDSEYLKGFRAFPRDPTSIETVLDDALVLNSLQKPRRISIRGSDGKIYNLLCKPKDDLRKDQRLMEFNNMINRFLKRDVEASKRRLYIKTYAVTPLNEECGLIEWVDNLRTLRDLVIKLLHERGIVPDYKEIKIYLNEACSDVANAPIFKTKILSKLQPVLHEWFVEMFPETEAWFTARLRYTRSTAVMSMVGYVLGLGDRHGENILFEEGTGGVLHVDFNCLFDKGLTFDIPELVPFRLTHNMVDAFGAYGYDGPFRRTCEITLRLLRQNEDALMTILETFLHDPTTDFIGKKRRTQANVPETPAGVLESVRSKLRGLLPGESVPLSVDGHVDELIMQATDIRNLAAMYIGWCAFF